MRVLVSPCATLHHETCGSALLGLCFFQTSLLIVERGGSDGAKLPLVGHVALRHMVEHRGQDVRQQSQLLDLAYGQSQRHIDRLLGPTERDQSLDRPPLIDRIQRLAGDVLDHRAHRAIVIGGLDNEHVDLLETGCDRLLHAAVTGIDDIAVAAAGFGDNEGRLYDADGLDRRQQQGIGLRRGLGLTRIVGIVLQRARIELHEVHGKFSCSGISGPARSGGPYSSSSRRHPPARGADGPVQLRASIPARSSERGLKPCAGRRGRDRDAGG
jgi:hypothetical protein